MVVSIEKRWWRSGTDVVCVMAGVDVMRSELSEESYTREGGLLYKRRVLLRSAAMITCGGVAFRTYMPWVGSGAPLTIHSTDGASARLYRVRSQSTVRSVCSYSSELLPVRVVVDVGGPLVIFRRKPDRIVSTIAEGFILRATTATKRGVGTTVRLLIVSASYLELASKQDRTVRRRHHP